LVILVFVLGAFLVGLAAAMWRLPRLATTAMGQLCYGAATSLCGAALAVAVTSVWELVRAMDLLSRGTLSEGGVSISITAHGLRSDLLLGGLSDLALRVGVLTALAALVYVLGPPDRRA
jgi:hypothetical protein